MTVFLLNLAAGVLANLISDGVEAGAKYVLSTREVDMELRKSVNRLERRQLNIEGAIDRLVNNQELLISLFSTIIDQYQLQSQVYVENQNIIVVANPNDINLLNAKNIIDSHSTNDIKSSEQLDVFDEYHQYVKKMRGLD